MLRTMWDDVGRIVGDTQDLVGPVSGGLRVEGNERSFGQPGRRFVEDRHGRFKVAGCDIDIDKDLAGGAIILMTVG